VTNLVSSSIVGMDPGQVTVTDSTGHVLAAPGTGITAGAGDARSQAEQTYEARLAANAQQILDTIVGPGHSKVSVRADVDLNKKQSTSETYTYTPGTPPLSSSGTTEKYNGTGAPVGGVLGPENMPNATSAAGGASTYDKTTATDNNAVDKTTTTIDAAPGALNRLTVSVVMDNGVAGSLNQNQIQSLVGNAVGLDTARGDAITVASMPFDTTAAKQAAADLNAAKAAESSAQMWSMIKTGGIAAGIALVVLLVWLRSRRREEIEEEYEPLELSDDMLAELDRLRVASSREELPKVDNRQLELEAAERQKVRGDISTMVSERPDEVAAMLRGWLSENKA
jgi:flagellar M-ring protein FliF